jgi:hypothetical protein
MHEMTDITFDQILAEELIRTVWCCASINLPRVSFRLDKMLSWHAKIPFLLLYPQPNHICVSIRLFYISLI